MLARVGHQRDARCVSATFTARPHSLQNLAFGGRYFRKGHRLYLHIFYWPETGLVLTGLKTPVISDRVLGASEAVSAAGPLPTDNDVHLSTPNILDPYATIIEFGLAGTTAVKQTTALTPVMGIFTLRTLDSEPHRSQVRCERSCACDDCSAGIGAGGGSPVAGKVSGTGGWTTSVGADLMCGVVHLKARKQTVAVRATSKPRLAVMNLHPLCLIPAR